MLVAYAGKDPTEVPVYVSENSFLLRQSGTRPQRAYRMFLAGADTADIAKRIGRHERSVLRWITIERSKRLGLPLPQMVKP
jgi:hypothetical protein